MEMHNRRTISNFAEQHIEVWDNTKLTVYISCGENMPTIRLLAYQFRPKGLLKHQVQYSKFKGHAKEIVPLGLKHIEVDTLQKCREYINEIACTHMEELARLYFQEEQEKEKSTFQ
jgi:hypothetical protein